MLRQHLQIGELGENAAADYLELQGHRILRRNFRTRFGEIDIITQEADVIVFVEVKTRSSRQFGEGWEAVDQTRIKRLSRAGEFFLRENKLAPRACRIDVVVVFWEGNKAVDVQQYRNITS